MRRPSFLGSSKSLRDPNRYPKNVSDISSLALPPTRVITIRYVNVSAHKEERISVVQQFRYARGSQPCH